MASLRRNAITALVAVLMAVPVAASALEDAPTVETDRAATDRATDVRPDRDLSEIKARALATIDKQLDVLARLRSEIANARFVSEAHAADLLADVATAADGLTELARKIEAATTVEELRELIEHIGDYKIAQVLAPKTHQVIGSDTTVAAARKLEAYSSKLADVITRFETAGFDVDEAWRILESMKLNTAEGLRLGGPVAEAVIGLQASDWPDPAQGVLAAGRSDLRAARDALKQAHGNAADIATFLRNLLDASTDVAVAPAASDSLNG